MDCNQVGISCEKHRQIVIAKRPPLSQISMIRRPDLLQGPYRKDLLFAQRFQRDQRFQREISSN